MPDTTVESIPYILGLDLGTSSLGWAVVRVSPDNTPEGLIAAGVRCFQAGVEGDIEQGKDSSRAAVRRQKRLPRRQIERRARRQRVIYRHLQRAGMLPAVPSRDPVHIHAAILALDATLRAKFLPEDDHVAQQLLPYRLRAAALDRKLELHELGRALYHLAQRRGFLSNRKTDKPVEDDEEAGKVKSGIGELEQDIAASGARTLGEYFSKIDPDHAKLRRRYTHRDMYKREFLAIWEAQAPHHPDILTDKLRRALAGHLAPDELHKSGGALFKQRPLKSAKHLIGRCELEPLRRRATVASPIYQRFRLLQAVNHLEVIAPTGEVYRLTDPDHRAERNRLIDELEVEGDRTFDQVRKLLGYTKARKRKGSDDIDPGHEFNLERGGEKKIPGDRTGSKLRAALGDRWDQLPASTQQAMVHDLLDYEDAKALAERAVKRYGLTPEQAAAFSAIDLQQGYARYSRKALAKLVEHMEAGDAFSEARKKAYPEAFEAKVAVDALPLVVGTIKELRNPAICRALTELRKVVNAIIRKYGKPETIRIELARELKQPRKRREENSKRNRDREKERDSAKGRIDGAKLGIQNPSRSDIEKVLLADECGWVCPYTGKAISIESLVGPHPQFDVEHILPFAQSLDNTFLNKTLCLREENACKGKRSPFEAYHGDEQKWHAILGRVRRFHGSAAKAKLRRFQMPPEEVKEYLGDDFTERHLRDTAYASRLAADYVALLYGGRSDDEHVQRVQVSPGGATAELRNEWGMNGILNDGGTKTRDDHRHHAVDAVAIALTGPKAVKELCDAAEQAAKTGRRRFAPLESPWDDFLDDLRKTIAGIVVSHRVDRRVSGALHEETNYSQPVVRMEEARTGKIRRREAVEYRHVRKLLVAMTANEIESIVDDRVRALVKEKLGESEPKKVFADEKSLPCFETKDGRRVPIKKARIRKKVAVITAGKGKDARYVAPGSNHHMAIVEAVSVRGKTWEGHLVSRFEANRRRRCGESVVQKEWGPGQRLVMTLSPGECIQVAPKNGTLETWKVISVSARVIEFRLPTDARPATVVRKIPNARITSAPSSLLDLKARKVTVTPLGEVQPAND